MLKAKKSYSQNWLIDAGIKNKIARKLEALLQKYPYPVLEIGPGRLDVTRYILPVCQKYNSKLWAIEIDNEAIEHVNKQIQSNNFLAKKDDFELIKGDALETLKNYADNLNSKNTYEKSPEIDFSNKNNNIENQNSIDLKSLNLDKFILFSSLPYSVGSRILVELSCGNQNPFLVICQKEVGKKMLNNEINLLGGFLNLYYDLKYHFDIPGQCFSPKPKVTSCLIEGRPFEVD